MHESTTGVGVAGRRSVLEEKPMRPPIAGKIRVGTKVLTRNAASNPEAVKIYRNGLAEDASFDNIEREIERVCKLSRALTPKNTPHFRVVRRDFTAPHTADRILELYGEDRGEGRNLYRFPVVFAFDDWMQNMPHGLRAFTQSGLKYWSEYDAAGDRYCMTYAAPDVKNERAKRVWGGRRQVIRDVNEGRCDPSKCAEYQSRKCTLSGRLMFYIPGIPGSSLIELETTSFYSLQQMRGQLELVSAIRHGRLSGTHQGKPIFYLSKVEDDVVMLDDKGQPTKKRQFLVNLEADIEMVDVMASSDNAIANGRRAVAALSPPAPDVVDAVESAVVEPPPAAPADDGDDIGALDRAVRAELRARPALDVDQWSASVLAKHGKGWSKDPVRMKAVLTELRAS